MVKSYAGPCFVYSNSLINEARAVNTSTQGKSDGEKAACVSLCIDLKRFDDRSLALIGLNTAANLNEQTNQLERINTKASGIQNDIKRANRILYAYRRRMMQDRATVILLLLVVLGIIGIVIYSTVVPDQSSFAVPDEAKPPTPEEVERAARL